MDPSDLAHLLRRTEFVARPSRLAELGGLSVAQAVDNIIDFGPNGNPQLPDRLKSVEADGWQQYVYAYNWWIAQMLGQPRPFQEKMTLFWHGHFVSSWWDGVDRADHMMSQNQLYRTLALGNFVELTQKMAIEPAMLIYLSNGENVKGTPNENFARELMELFTLGVGNYAESDVQASARAWTGHNYSWDAKTYVWRPNKHDTGQKTFFGTTKNWDGPDIIDEILRDNVAKQLIAAKFIAKKLWEFLAYTGPAQNIVDELAAAFVSSGMNLQVLLRALLNRSEFYGIAAKQGLVRTPVEWSVALCYHTGRTADQLGLSWASESMGQSLYNPPNVSGWRSNAYWLNTSALNGRASIARGVTWGLRDSKAFDVLDRRQNGTYAMTVEGAVDWMAAYFGMTSLSASTRNALISAHAAERTSTPWGSWWAATNLATMTMLAPEFHMA